MRRITRNTPAWIIAGVLAFSGSLSAAQTRVELPASIIEAGTIGATERTQIDRFVAEIGAQATGTDAEAASRARRELIAPLTARQPSVAFRQAYAQSASSLMQTLMGSDDATAKAAGLRLAGNLATPEAATIVRNALVESDPGLKLFAAVQARRVFEVTANAGPAMPESQILQLVEALGTTLGEDPNTPQTQAVIRALGAGSLIRSRDLSNTRSRSLVGLSTAARGAIAGIGPGDLLEHEDTLLLAASTAVRSVSEAGATVSDEGAKAAAELGGEILALTLQRHSQNLMGTDRDADLRLVNAAESLIYFARRRQVENARGNVAAVPQTRLAELLENQDRGFRNELVRLIGPGSEVLRQFGLPDNRFIR